MGGVKKYIISIKKGKLVIPKFIEGIEIKLSRPITGKIRQATISKTSTGKYFVSILCETRETYKNKSQIKEETAVGVDLGVKYFMVTSDSEVINNPKHLSKVESRLKYLQRRYSKYKGKRTKDKLVKLHEKVTNRRKDFLHKLSTKLIRENQTICLEDLDVEGMMQNRHLAQSISDASWSEFNRMIEYKAEWYGVNVLRIGRFEPSSKTCSNCGDVNKGLQLKDREWTCKSCEETHDRDINAAVNIKNFALRNYVSGTDTQNQNELPSLEGVLTSENP